MRSSRAVPSAPSCSTAGRSCPATVAASINRWAHCASSGSAGRPEPVDERSRAEREVALRVRRDRVQHLVERGDATAASTHSAPRTCEVVVAVQAVAEPTQPVAELAEVEAVAPALGDGAQRARAAPGRRTTVAGSARLARPARAGFAAAVVERCQRRRRAAGDAGNPSSARRMAGASSVGHRQAAEPLVQRDPAVDATRHRDGADVVAERHLGVALGAQLRRIAAGAGPAGGVQGVHRVAVVDERVAGRRPCRTGADPSRRSPHWSRSPRRRRCRPSASAAIPACVASWSAEATIDPSARVEVNGAAVPDIVATYAAGVGASQNRQLIGPVLMTIGAGVAVAGSFGDWLTSGTVGRSSYDILGLVDRLGFAPDGPVGWMVRAWPLMPLLLTAAVVAAWWGRRVIRCCRRHRRRHLRRWPRCRGGRSRPRAAQHHGRRRTGDHRRGRRGSSCSGRSRSCSFGYRPRMPTRARSTSPSSPGPSGPFEIGTADVGGRRAAGVHHRARPACATCGLASRRHGDVAFLVYEDERVTYRTRHAASAPRWLPTWSQAASAGATASRSRCATTRSG